MFISLFQAGVFMRLLSCIPKLFLTILLIGTQANLLAMRGHERKDPLGNLKYRIAFDQAKIHQEFADCMEQWGCASNVFDDVIPEQRSVIHKKIEDNVQLRMSREKAYQEACLKQLRRARFWALSEPLQDFAGSVAISSAAAWILSKVMAHMEKESHMAKGFGVLDAVYNIVYRCGDAMRACIHLVRPPEARLDRLEELFAKNMCFIPRKLWGQIIEQFMEARTNKMSDTQLANLEFAINLTVYKKHNQLKIAHDISLDDAIQEICVRIDNFFRHSYQVPQDYSTEDIEGIKKTVRQFLYALANDAQDNNPIKPLHLKGSHGIGKSYFVVDNLYKWIDELFPGSVRFEQTPYLQGANELQGSTNHDHGIMLDIVHNQCKENKRGSLIFMDEATWLNSPGMVDAAKVVFNGSQSRISTKYFGDAIDIPVPPMLIIVASNEPIKDEHLANRFMSVEFPKPTVNALVDYAMQVVQQDQSLRLAGLVVDRQDVQDFISPMPLKCATSARKSIDNFRDADKVVVNLLAAKSHKKPELLVEEVL